MKGVQTPGIFLCFNILNSEKFGGWNCDISMALSILDFKFQVLNGTMKYCNMYLVQL